MVSVDIRKTRAYSKRSETLLSTSEGYNTQARAVYFISRSRPIPPPTTESGKGIERNIFEVSNTSAFEQILTFTVPDVPLSSRFKYENREQVQNFLANHRYLQPLLMTLEDEVHRRFPNSPIRLFVDVDFEGEDGRLIAAIEWQGDSETALELEEQFQEDWWLEERNKGKNKLIVFIEPQ